MSYPQYSNGYGVQYPQHQPLPQQYSNYNTAYEPPKSINSDLKHRFSNPSSVYVGDIPKEMSLQELIGYFNKFGIKDSFTKQAREQKWYAYFRFEKEESAAAAKKEFNHKEIRGKQLRVTDFKNMKELPDKGNLFIKGYEGVKLEDIDILISKLSSFSSAFVPDNGGERIAEYTFYDDEEYRNLTAHQILILQNISYQIQFEIFENKNILLVRNLPLNIQIFEVDRALMDLMTQKKNIIFSSKINKFNYICVQLTNEDRAQRLVGREIYLNDGILKIQKFVSASQNKLNKNNVLHIKTLDMSHENLEKVLKEYIHPEENFKIKEEVDNKKLSALIYFSSANRIEEFQKQWELLGNEAIMNLRIKKSKQNLLTYNLRQNVTADILKKSFEYFGKVSSCRVIFLEKNKLPLKNPYAFIHFEDQATEEIVRKDAPQKIEIKKLYEGFSVKFSKKFEKPANSHRQNNPVINPQMGMPVQHPGPMFGPQGYPYIQPQSHMQMSNPQPQQIQYPQQVGGGGFYQQPYNQYQQQYNQTQNFRQPQAFNNYGFTQGQQQRPRSNQPSHSYQGAQSHNQNYTSGHSNYQGMGGGHAGHNQNHNHQQNLPGGVRQPYNLSMNAQSNIHQQPRKTPVPTPDFINNFKDILENRGTFLSNNSEENMRHILGSHIFKKIDSLVPNPHVPKITGMLIDKEVFTVNEIIELLQDDPNLIDRVNEALDLINDQANSK